MWFGVFCCKTFGAAAWGESATAERTAACPRQRGIRIHPGSVPWQMINQDLGATSLAWGLEQCHQHGAELLALAGTQGGEVASHRRGSDGSLVVEEPGCAIARGIVPQEGAGSSLWDQEIPAWRS